MIMYGSTFSPNSTPRILPPSVATNAYPRYLAAIADLSYPSAFMVPISIRCSSTIRVILVRLISAATRKNSTGNTPSQSPHPVRILSVSVVLRQIPLSYRYQSGSSILSISSWGSAISCSASANSASASAFPSSYSFFASASSCSLSAILASPTFNVCSWVRISAQPSSICCWPTGSGQARCPSCAFEASRVAFGRRQLRCAVRKLLLCRLYFLKSRW